MFLDEFAPIWNQLSHQPVAFLGGFVSGLLRLNLSEDPVNSWLNQQTGTTAYASTTGAHNGKSSGPQSISID